ncbi:hypothetical protein INR49_030142 [Caranx melampygus]|nr:hypothetical protein INR49_030142 [Caranx melampygus]
MCGEGASLLTCRLVHPSSSLFLLRWWQRRGGGEQPAEGAWPPCRPGSSVLALVFILVLRITVDRRFLTDARKVTPSFSLY